MSRESPKYLPMYILPVNVPLFKKYIYVLKSNYTTTQKAFSARTDNKNNAQLFS